MLHDAEAAHVVPDADLGRLGHIVAVIRQSAVMLAEGFDQLVFDELGGSERLRRELPLKEGIRASKSRGWPRKDHCIDGPRKPAPSRRSQRSIRSATDFTGPVVI
jgi:hypothetical protein